MFQPPSEKFWVCDSPVVSPCHWHVPFEKLSLPALRKSVSERKFLFVHGHSRSGKTSHRLKLAEELKSHGFIVYSIQFEPGWLASNNTTETFWAGILSALRISPPSTRTPSFQDLHTHLQTFPAQSMVVFLFDEFQILIKSNILGEFLGALKTYRDNTSEYHVVSCICFGTFKIMMMADTQNKYSPFHVQEAIQLGVPDAELLLNTLKEYNSTIRVPMKEGIPRSIITQSAGHLGIFSLLCKVLHDKMAVKGHSSFLQWVKVSSSKEVYSQLRYSKPYQQIVDSLLANDLALYKFLQSEKILFEQGPFNLADSEAVFELQDVGVLEWCDGGQYNWTSPIIRDFVIQYCEVQVGTIVLPGPVVRNHTKLDVIETLKLLVPFINLQSIIGLNPGIPQEAAFHAEMYRLLVTSLRNSSLHNYTVYFEGRVDKASTRWFDLFICNDEKYVVELKIRAHTETTLSDAVTQVYEYGKAMDAHQCIVIDFTDHQPTPNLFSTIRSQNLMLDEDDNADYTQSNNPAAPFADVHVVHFVYTNDWKSIIGGPIVEI